MTNRPTILIVDDDPDLRRTLSDILGTKGYETVAAEDGSRGLALIGQGSIDVEIIDLRLPDMPGLEVLRKAKDVSPRTEAIILTGYADLESAIEATNMGAFSYVRKPYEVDDLLLHIRRAIEKQSDQEEIAHLASFPRMSPMPVIEISEAGNVIYVNPAAERVFPGLRSIGSRHAAIAGVKEIFDTLQKSEYRQSLREVEFGDAVYEEHIYVPENGFIRIYAFDVSERKRAEMEMRRNLDEVERLNKLMVGRELKMEELRKEISAFRKRKDEKGK